MSDDLKQRVVTAVVLLVALIALTLLTTPSAFAAVVAVIIMLAAWEWGAFAQFEGVALRLFYTLSVLIALVGAAALSGFWSSAESFTLFRVILILCFGVLWWCIAAFLLVGYPGIQPAGSPSYNWPDGPAGVSSDLDGLGGPQSHLALRLSGAWCGDSRCRQSTLARTLPAGFSEIGR